MKKLLFLCLFFIFTPLVLAQSEESANGANVLTDELTDVSELTPQLKLLNDDFDTLEAIISAKDDFLNKIKNDLEANQERLKKLNLRLEEVSGLSFVNSDHTSELSTKIKEITDKNDADISEFTSVLKELNQYKEDWQKKKSNWQGYRRKFSANYNIVRDVFSTANERIQQALKDIDKMESPLLEWQSELFNFQSETKELDKKIGDFLDEFKKNIFTKNSDSFFTKAFWESCVNIKLAELSESNSKFFSPEKVVGDNFTLMFLLQCLILVGTYLFLRYLSKKDVQRPHLKKLIGIPLSVSLCFSTLLVAPHYQLPPIFRLILGLVLTLSAFSVVATFITIKECKKFLYILIVALVISILLTDIKVPEQYIRLYIVAASIFIFTILCFYRHSLNNQLGAGVICFFSYLLMGVMLMACVTQVAGYSQLSIKIFDASIRTIFSCIIAWLLMTLFSEGIFAFFNYSFFHRLNFLKNNVSFIQRKLTILVCCIICFFTLLLLMQIWEVFGNFRDSLNFVMQIGVTLWGVHFSVKSVLIALCIFVAICFCSWMLRQILNEEVYPKVKVERGVAASINRILQYLFVFFGIVLALSSLGFELKNLAVAFGVLGVGVGFGLQTIVNNFASGVILLLERPIKLGDIITIHDKRGEVKKIGLRTTVVEMLDSSEIIVPNSEIASSMVTNWTLTNRRIKNTIEVAVAYGSDLDKVKEVLIEIAKRQELSICPPDPVVHFVELGDFAVSVKLYVWSRVENCFQLKSDILADIHKTFQEEGISIPFPRQDIEIINKQ